MNNTNKVAYVLSGGGAKGCLQVGMMLALHERGIRPDKLYGTSVGALNSFGYAMQGIEKLHEHWLTIEGRKDILKLNLWNTIIRKGKGIYTMQPLREWLNSALHEDALMADCSVCYTDMKNSRVFYAELKEMNRADYVDYVLASACIPFFMESPLIFGKHAMVDGGTREMVPFKKAVQEGFKEIYVLLCNPQHTNMAPDWELKHETDAAMRALEMLEFDVYKNDLAVIHEYMKRDGYNIKIIAPDEVLCSTLEFNPEKVRQGIEIGRRKANQLWST